MKIILIQLKVSFVPSPSILRIGLVHMRKLSERRKIHKHNDTQ